MYTYRNKNTGHTVSSETKWRRLEALANWERTGPTEDPEPDSVEIPDDEGDDVPGEDEALPRPAQNASKDAWVEYVCLTFDFDEATASGMTKAELIAYDPSDDE